MRALKQGVQFLLFCLMLFIPVWGWAQSVQRTQSGSIIRWHVGTIDFVVDPSLLDDAAFMNATDLVQQAARPWETITATVPRFTVYAEELDRNRSGIRFYRRGFPAIVGKRVLAITLLTHNTVTGEITDADILVDGEHNTFRVLTHPILGVADAPYDLGNVLTHEFGHVLGLSHDVHPDAAMYPSSNPGEIHKRYLTGVDRASIVEGYTHTRARNTGLPAGDSLKALEVAFITCASLLLLILIVLIFPKLYESNRSRIMKASVTAALLLLVLGYPRAQPQTTEHGLVVNSRSFWNRGVMHTVATVQTAHGLESVRRIGGRIGNYEQQVLDAPSGHQLKRGTRVPLHN